MRKRTILGLGLAACMTIHERGIAQPPVSERPTITVAIFEFGTVSIPVRGELRTRRPQERGGGYDNVAFAEAIGTGAADLLVEQLVGSQRFRVFERRQLDAVMREQGIDADSADSIARARYIVTGSVSFVGMNSKEIGGLAAGVASAALFRGLGAMRTSRSFTTVRLTARVVDTRSGEIIGSFTGEGESKKRWSIGALGAGRGGLGAGSVADRDFRESAVGEATARAAAAIAEHVVALRATRLGP